MTHIRYDLPPQLLDCSEHAPGSGAELFIVEGESAAQSVSRMRNLQLQAVLPMQGKPLNAYKAQRATVKKNPLYAALLQAIGCTDLQTPDLLRYDRVILLFDPDADGIHSGALMLLFFYRWLRPLLDEGKLCLLRPPLFEIANRDRTQIHFAYTDEQYRELHGKFPDTEFKKQRYRGLGSIDADVLYQTCVNPATRKLYRLSARDAEASLAIFGGKLPSS